MLTSRELILSTLHARGPLTHPQLCDATGINRFAVWWVLRWLVRSGEVRTFAAAPSEEQAAQLWSAGSVVVWTVYAVREEGHV